MRVLKIIHGWPPLYNARSEERRVGKDVHVFTREENMLADDGAVRQARDTVSPQVKLNIVNAARVGNNFNNSKINSAFAGVVDEVRPDIAHIGHLNHLSLGIVDALAERMIPIVFTLHDFWLMCLRGQFIKVSASPNGEVMPLCDGQDDQKCAERCMRRFAATDADAVKNAYWQDWVSGRMAAVRHVAEMVDMFIAPAKSLAERFHKDFNLPRQKTIYIDYGFNHQRLSGRRRVRSDKFVFGYIGTHIPSKGVAQMLQAFEILAASDSACELHVWGRESTDTKYLKALATLMAPAISERIVWRGEYDNTRIVSDVFNNVDAVVVPSIWLENSPLVIHEAQQARLPVITAAMGGMAEYVRHDENGLLFAPRNVADLARQMQKLASDTALSDRLGRKGYLYSQDGNVPHIAEHVRQIEEVYDSVINARRETRITPRKAPWRITFDTNPDHCNYKCTMCEEHSPYSPLQFQRRADGVAKRVMPFDIIERNVRSMASRGLREIIPSTMGEPLLYKRFEDIIALCRETGVKLNLTTNGSFPRLGAKAWAKLLTPVCSDIKISWNGACKQTQEAIMLNGNWEDMLANTRVLIAVRDALASEGGNRCRITFQMTFMEANVAELPDIVRLAAELGVDRVKGHHLWAHFTEIAQQDMRRDVNAIQRWNEIARQAQAAAEAHLLPNGRQVLLENIHPLVQDQVGGRGVCPFLGSEAWVDAHGRFNPCCAPDAERRSLGDFGNLNERDLMDIWNSNDYRLLVNTYATRPVCLKCNMRRST